MRVTVVIPLYNKARYIGRAIASVLRQSFVDFELLVIDDGSTDDSAGTATRYADDPRVRLIRQQNRGPGLARARGMEAAQGEYLAFLDADDEWLPHHLATAVRLLDDFPQAGWGGVGYCLVFPHGAPHPARVYGLPDGEWRGVLADYFTAALGDPPISSSSAIVRTAMARACHLQHPGARLGEDLFLWCQLALHAPVAFDSTLCAYYHTEADGRALHTVRAADELPFVPWLKDQLTTGTLTYPHLDSVRRFLDYYQWLHIRAVLLIQRNPRMARRLLACWEPTPAYTQKRRRFMQLARLPAVLIPLVHAFYLVLLRLRGMRNGGASA